MTTDRKSSHRHPDGSAIEPLPALARFSFDWAPTLCNPDHGCMGYHRMWSMVRLLESNSALPEGSDFFDAEIPKVARNGVAKIILSGGADTGLMTLAVNACGRAGITPEITMIDRCATPLQQCTLFAKMIGVKFRPIQGTLDELNVEPADAILAHSFLPFFPPEARSDLFASWSRNLRPGGKVLMSQRLVQPGEYYIKDTSPDYLDARARTLVDAFERSQPIGIDPEDLADAAKLLWRHGLSGRGVTKQDLDELCVGSDLSIEAMKVDANQENKSPSVGGPRAKKRIRTGIVFVKAG